jgi:hypothetical protein
MHAPIFTAEPLERRQLFSTGIYSVQPIGYEESATGITASWDTQPWSVAMHNNSATLTLEGSLLEAYDAVTVTGRLDMYSQFGVPTTVTIAVGQSDVEVLAGIDPDENPWKDFAMAGQVEGDEIQIMFSGSGFDQSSGRVWSMLDLSVQVGDIVISVESEVITVGSSEEVTISAFDELGNPVENLSLDIESEDSGIIAPQVSTVATDEHGMARVDVDAVAPGYADLLATMQGAPATTQPTAATQAALKISTRDAKPTTEAVNQQIANLDSDESTVRAAARAELTRLSKQHSDVFKAVVAKRGEQGISEEMQAGLEQIISEVGVAADVAPDGTITIDTSTIKLAVGQKLGASSVSTGGSGDRILVKNGNDGPDIFVALFPGDLNAQLVAKGAGEVEVFISVHVETLAGEHVATIQGSVLLRVKDAP